MTFQTWDLMLNQGERDFGTVCFSAFWALMKYLKPFHRSEEVNLLLPKVTAAFERRTQDSHLQGELHQLYSVAAERGAGREGKMREVKMGAEILGEMEGQTQLCCLPAGCCVHESLVLCMISKVEKRNLFRCNWMLTVTQKPALKVSVADATHKTRRCINLLQILLSGLKSILKYGWELTANTSGELGEKPLWDQLSWDDGNEMPLFRDECRKSLLRSAEIIYQTSQPVHHDSAPKYIGWWGCY